MGTREEIQLEKSSSIEKSSLGKVVFPSLLEKNSLKFYMLWTFCFLF